MSFSWHCTRAKVIFSGNLNVSYMESGHVKHKETLPSPFLEVCKERYFGFVYVYKKPHKLKNKTVIQVKIRGFLSQITVVVIFSNILIRENT